MLSRDHRSTAAERLAYRESAADFQAHSVSVRQMMTQRPGLRSAAGGEAMEAVATDFTAVLDFLSGDRQAGGGRDSGRGVPPGARGWPARCRGCAGCRPSPAPSSAAGLPAEAVGGYTVGSAPPRARVRGGIVVAPGGHAGRRRVRHLVADRQANGGASRPGGPRRDHLRGRAPPTACCGWTQASLVPAGPGSSCASSRSPGRAVGGRLAGRGRPARCLSGSCWRQRSGTLPRAAEQISRRPGDPAR